MAAEFRQRTPGEFFQMLKRSKWHIILPTLAVGIAVAFVVSKLPDMYQSKTTLTLKPPQISTKVVQDLTEEDLSQRLQTMNQEILSRSTLEPMIGKYKLFENEKTNGLPMELIVDKMRKNIEVEPEKSEDNRVTGFKLTYKDRTPESARNVVADLAGKYVNQQVQGQIDSADTTKKFIDDQLNSAKTQLDTIEQERLLIMSQNVETLPESAQSLIAQLTNLGTRSQTISKEKETLIIEKGRLNETINSNNRQIRLIEDFGEKETQDAARQASQIEDTPAYAQLKQKRGELNAQLDNLLKQYKDKHPDVIGKKNEIIRINEEIEDLKKNIDKRVQVASQSSGRKSGLQKQSLENENERIKNQITQVDGQIAAKTAEMQQNVVQVSGLESKLNTIPNVKLALEAINNRYQMAKNNYDELSKKNNDADWQLKRDQSSQGETIRVVDPANLPSSPINATKKPMFIGLGAGIGLVLGLFLAGIFEIPRLFKIQNIEDAKHYTGLPVLASVPPLLTRKELSWLKRTYWLKVLAGIIAAFGAIPLLIILLQKTRIFERFVS